MPIPPEKVGDGDEISLSSLEDYSGKEDDCSEDEQNVQEKQEMTSEQIEEQVAESNEAMIVDLPEATTKITTEVDMMPLKYVDTSILPKEKVTMQDWNLHDTRQLANNQGEFDFDSSEGLWQHDHFLQQEMQLTSKGATGQLLVDGQWLSSFDVYPTARSEMANELRTGFVKGMHCHAWRFKGSCSLKEKCGWIHAVAEQGSFSTSENNFQQLGGRGSGAGLITGLNRHELLPRGVTMSPSINRKQLLTHQQQHQQFVASLIASKNLRNNMQLQGRQPPSAQLPRGRGIGRAQASRIFPRLSSKTTGVAPPPSMRLSQKKKRARSASTDDASDVSSNSSSADDDATDDMSGGSSTSDSSSGSSSASTSDNSDSESESDSSSSSSVPAKYVKKGRGHASKTTSSSRLLKQPNFAVHSIKKEHSRRHHHGSATTSSMIRKKRSAFDGIGTAASSTRHANKKLLVNTKKEAKTTTTSTRDLKKKKLNATSTAELFDGLAKSLSNIMSKKAKSAKQPAVDDDDSVDDDAVVVNDEIPEDDIPVPAAAATIPIFADDPSFAKNNTRSVKKPVVESTTTTTAGRHVSRRTVLDARKSTDDNDELHPLPPPPSFAEAEISEKRKKKSEKPQKDADESGQHHRQHHVKRTRAKEEDAAAVRKQNYIDKLRAINAKMGGREVTQGTSRLQYDPEKPRMVFA